MLVDLVRELQELIARHVRDDKAPEFDHLSLTAIDRPTDPLGAVYEPVFALVAQGSKRTILGNKTFDYGEGQYLVVSVDLPLIGHVTDASSERPFLALNMPLRPTEIATLLLEAGECERGSVKTALAVSDASADLVDAVIRLLRLLDHPEDNAVIGPLIKREILWRLIHGDQGAMVRQIGLADSRLSQIARATQWIRTHYAQRIRIDELADIAGMSVATFFRHFRTVTAISPIQYQKRIRLQEARTRLMTRPREVTSVGFEVGYENPSQFSREYQRLFGTPPSRDTLRESSEDRAVP